jgi:dinuclear metal center YbgI/SA1388 family protein
MKLAALQQYLDHLLEIHRYQDYCPNGLHVQGCADISVLVTGVTASLALIKQAQKLGAHALLVHHGFFWRGEKPEIIGLKHQRIAHLIKQDISLLAYHLPLDAHPIYGNNARLAEELGITVTGTLDTQTPVPLGLVGEFADTLTSEQCRQRIETVLERKPLHFKGTKKNIHTVAWVTGAGQDFIELASAHQVDAFITGEVSERTYHLAKELDIHFFAAGHHATERYGIKAIGHHVADVFGLEHHFIDIDNPV